MESDILCISSWVWASAAGGTGPVASSCFSLSPGLGALHWGIHRVVEGKQSWGDRAGHRVSLGVQDPFSLCSGGPRVTLGPPAPSASFLWRLPGSRKCLLQSLTDFEERKAVTSAAFQSLVAQYHPGVPGNQGP